MLVTCRQYWECMCAARRVKINPAYHPRIGDGSDRYIVVKCDIKDAAVIADQDARTRQVVRNIMRRRSALTYLPEKSYLAGILQADRVVGPDLACEEQRCCSEWLTTATRRKPFRTNYLSDEFLRAVPSFDEFDGWVELSELLYKWPPEGSTAQNARRLSGFVSAPATGRIKN
eukprot:8534400-Pyramimonas_sp.AAC.1